MKVIGLLGCMSWRSSLYYYQTINQVVSQKLGGLTAAKTVLYSVNKQELENFFRSPNWGGNIDFLCDGIRNLEKINVDFIVLCSNVMHQVSDRLQARTHIPIIDLVDVITKNVHEKKITKIALLGSKHILTQEIYRQVLEEKGLEVTLPHQSYYDESDRIIFKELCQGIIRQESKVFYLQMIDNLIKQGVKGVLLGNSELGLLIKQYDVKCPVFDAAYLHAEHAALLSLTK